MPIVVIVYTYEDDGRNGEQREGREETSASKIHRHQAVVTSVNLLFFCRSNDFSSFPLLKFLFEIKRFSAQVVL